MNAEAMRERFEMRLTESTLEQLDAWRGRQSDVPSRSEAVRRLVEAGLSVTGDKTQIKLSDGEKLTLMMLCQLLKNLKLRSDIDPEFVEAAITGGHFWGLESKYDNIFQDNEDKRVVIKEVRETLLMWNSLENGFRKLSKKGKGRVAKEAGPFGEDVVFRGFYANDDNEAEYGNIARFSIEKLNEFPAFKGRDLNAHMPTVEMYRRMRSVFDPISNTLFARELNASEITEILKAAIHPKAAKILTP